MEEMQISESYLADFRGYLRITSKAQDGEIKDCINAARGSLIRGGVLPERATDENDPLVKKAISNYVKAEFGLDNPDSEKYRAAFAEQKADLAMASEYIEAEEG